MTETKIPGTKEELKIYEDEKAVVFLSENPCNTGHLEVYPKEKILTIEDLDEETFVHLSYVASFASTAIFEGLGLQGTNIIVQSGSDANNIHDWLCFQVVPRKFDDGIQFQWQPKKLDERIMDDAKEAISNHTFAIGKEGVKKETTVIEEKSKEELSKEEDYLLKQWRKMP